MDQSVIGKSYRFYSRLRNISVKRKLNTVFYAAPPINVSSIVKLLVLFVGNLIMIYGPCNMLQTTLSLTAQYINVMTA